MITGSKFIAKSPAEVLDRLKLAMAGGNFELTSVSDRAISFKHGTLLTQSVPLIPKEGTIRVAERDSGTDVSYGIQIVGPHKYWLLFVSVVFCWLVFPPIVAYRALTHHPRQLMVNLLQAV